MFFLKSGSFLRTLFCLAAAAVISATAQAQATRFIVTESGGNNRLDNTSIKAGTPVLVRITAVDATGATVSAYNQTVTIKFAEPRQPSYFATQNNTASWATQTATLSGGVVDGVMITPIHAGSFDRRVTVTDGNISTYDAGQRVGDADGLFSVSPASFAVTISGSTLQLSNSQFLSDTPQLIRVRAINGDGTTAETYQGTVTLHSNTGLFDDFDVSFSGYENGVVDAQTLNFTAAGSGDTIQASDGLVTTANASGQFTVNTRATGTNADRIVISGVTGKSVPNPGQLASFAFTITNPNNGSPPVVAGGSVVDPGTPYKAVTGPIDFDVTVLDGTGAEIASTVVRFSGNLSGSYTVSASATLAGTIVIPATASPGTFSIKVTAVQSASGSLTVAGNPDLAITRFDYAPGQYRGGEAMRFDMTWYNLLSSPATVSGINSLVPAINGYRVEIHLSSNATFGDGDDILVWQGTYYGNGYGYDLLAGQAVSISDSFLLPKNVPGTFYLLAKINSAGGRVSTTDPTLNFSAGAGFTEVIGPKPGAVLYNGDNVVLPVESAKITLLPDQGPETNRISLTSSGAQATAALGLSDNPAMSQDGRFVAFQSRANLDGDGASASNNYNIFLRDALLGSTTLLTPGTTGATNGDCIQPHISSDAHYVVYQSSATNIVNGDSNGYADIFIRDTVKSSTVRLKPSSATQTNRDSFLPDISGDGRFVVFESNATNIIANANPFGLRQIYLYDRDVSNSGNYDTLGNTAFTLVSQTALVGGIPGNADSSTPRISRDGNYVVFSTTASNLINTTTPFSQIVRWTRATGVLQTVSVNISAALADGDTGYPIINGDGTYIVYASRAHNLTSDTYIQAIPYLFRAYVPALAVTQVVRINGYIGASATAIVNAGTGQLFGINLTNAGQGYTSAPSVTISGGGGVGATATTTIDVFTGRVNGLTMTSAGTGYSSAPTVTIGNSGLLEPGDSPFLQYLDLGSFEPAISDNGQTVAYASESVNLLPPIPVHNIDRTISQSTVVQNYQDRDLTSDVYVTDLSNPSSPQTNRASVSSFGYEATTSTTDGLSTVQIGQARSPAMSGDGGFVGFSFDGKQHNGLVFGLTNFDYLATNSAKDIYIYNAKKSSAAIVTDLPAVQLTIPNVITISANLNLPLSATITASPRPISKVEFYADGILVSTATSPAVAGSAQYVGTFVVSGLNVSTSRTFSLVAVAVDSLGARSLESNVSLVTVNPVVGKLPFTSITNPVTNLSVSNVSTLLVQANASDADGTVTSLGFYVDGVFVANGTSDGGFDYQASFSTNQFTPGVHILTSQVSDDSGNTVISSPVSFTITAATGAPPTIILSTVSPMSVSLGLPSVFQVNASASIGATISQVQFFANGNSVGIVTAAPFQLSYIAPSAGVYNIYAVVTDSKGNTVVSGTQTLTVSPTVLPSITLSTPVPANASLGLPAILQATATSNTAGVSITQVDFYSNGILVNTATTAPYTYNYIAPSAGTYTITAVATDSLGSTITSATQTLTVVPVVGIPLVAELLNADLPLTKVALGANLVLTINITEGNSAVQSVIVSARNSTGGTVVLGTATQVSGTADYQLIYTNTLPLDLYQVFASATDANGNISRTGERSIQSVAATTDSVTIQSPTDGQTLAILDTTGYERAIALPVVVTTNIFGDKTIQSITITNPGLGYGANTKARLEVVNDSVYASFYGTSIIERTYDLTTTIDAEGRILTIDAAGIADPVLQFYQTARIVIPDNFSVSSPISVKLGVTSSSGATSVSLYANGVLVDSRTSSPYTINWSPFFAGTYQLHAELIDGNGVLTTSSVTTITITAANSYLDGIGANGSTVYKELDNYYNVLLGRGIKTDEIPALNAQFPAGASDEDNAYALASVAANLVQSDTFRTEGATVILYHMAALNRVPTLDEYTEGLATLQASGGEAYLVQLLTSPEYIQKFGAVANLLVVDVTQYAKVKNFALNVYAGIYGTAKPNVILLAQDFMYRFSGLVPTGGNDADLVAQALIGYLSDLRSGKTSSILENRLRVVGLSYALRDGLEPTMAEIAAREKLSSIVVADNFLNNGPLVESKPIFALNPVGTSLVAGQSVVLVVNVRATPRASLQWYRDGKVIDGATGSTYTASVGGTYLVRATNTKGTVSSRAAKVIIVPLPPVMPVGGITLDLGMVGAGSINNGVDGITYFAKGLPSGLKIDKYSGEITGLVSAKAKLGGYTVSVWTQSGNIKSAVQTFTLVVQPYPVAFQGNKDSGPLTDGGLLTFGSVSISVSSSGAYTGRLVKTDLHSYTIRGNMVAEADRSGASSSLTIKGVGTLDLRLDAGGVLSVTLVSSGVTYTN